jgi:hypothetical protein
MIADLNLEIGQEKDSGIDLKIDIKDVLIQRKSIQIQDKFLNVKNIINTNGIIIKRVPLLLEGIKRK